MIIISNVLIQNMRLKLIVMLNVNIQQYIQYKFSLKYFKPETAVINFNNF